MSPTKIKAAICAVARNEAKYIREWIAFNKAIGFDHIFLYNNESTDDTAERARDFGDFVTVEDFFSKDFGNPQQRCYQTFMKTHGEKCEWVMFMDIDEFLNLKRHDSIAAFLDDHPQSCAIGINWRLFGDNGHAHASDRPVLERFTRASPPNFGSNHIIKTIAKTDAILEANAHSSKLKDGLELTSPNGTKLKMYPSVRQDIVDHDEVSVNHYFTKTKEEWDIKRARGKIATSRAKQVLRKESEFHHNNRNDVEDTSILRFMPRLEAVLEESPILVSTR